MEVSVCSFSLKIETCESTLRLSEHLRSARAAESPSAHPRGESGAEPQSCLHGLGHRRCREDASRRRRLPRDPAERGLSTRCSWVRSVSSEAAQQGLILRRRRAEGERLCSTTLPVLPTWCVQGESCARFRCSPTPPQRLEMPGQGLAPSWLSPVKAAEVPLFQRGDKATREAPSAEEIFLWERFMLQLQHRVGAKGSV